MSQKKSMSTNTSYRGKASLSEPGDFITQNYKEHENKFAFKKATPHNSEKKTTEKQAANKTKLHHLLPQPISPLKQSRLLLISLLLRFNSSECSSQCCLPMKTRNKD